MKRLTMIAVLLALLWPTIVSGQYDCPGGNCPDPRYQQRQGVFGRNWGNWSNYKEEPQQYVPKYTPDRRQSTKAPEWLVRVNGASGMLMYKDDSCGLVLTAYHVVGGTPRNVPIVFPDGTKAKGQAVKDEHGGNAAVNKQWDIAFLKIPPPKASPCSMTNTMPQVGDKVWVVGYGGGRLCVRPGTVKGYERDSWRGYYRKSDPPGTMIISGQSAVGGDSGGAVLNATGQLCGVISTSSDTRRHTQGHTKGPSAARIYALCADSRFLWPWQRPQWRGQVEEDIDGLEQNVQQIQFGQQRPPQQTPTPQVDLTPLIDRLARVEARLEATTPYLAEFAMMKGDVSELKQIVEAVKEVAGEGSSEQLATLVADVKAAKDAATRADMFAAEASQTAEQAGESALAAVETADTAVTRAGDVAANAASQAINIAEPRLFERIGDRLEGTIVGKAVAGAKDLVGEKLSVVTGAVGWMKNAIFGSYAGLGVLAFALWWTYSDIKKFIQTGGQNRLTIQHAADRTSNIYDDRAANAFAAGVQWVAEKTGRWPTPSPGEPSQQPSSSGPTDPTEQRG